MKKAVLKGIGDIEIVDGPEPILKDGEALIEVAACGICHADVAPYEGKNTDLFPFPVVCGHEFGGIIKEIKAEKSELKVGDKVAVCPILSCGSCYYCRQGFDQLCIGSAGESVQVSNFGTQAREGAFAQRVAVPLSNIIKLPQDFDMELTGIIEPAAVAYSNTKDIKDSNVVVVGAGAIGLLAVKFLKLNNNRVIAVDIAENALRLARKTGADFTVNISDKERASKIRDYLKGEMVDCVLLYFVSDDTLAFATDLIRKKGEIKFIGLSGNNFVKIDSLAMLVKSIRLHGYMAYPTSDFKEAVDVIVKNLDKLNLKELVSAKFPLEKAKEAFDFKQRENVAKVIIVN